MVELRGICDALTDLVPSVQFKKHEKHPQTSYTFIKVADFSKSRSCGVTQLSWKSWIKIKSWKKKNTAKGIVFAPLNNEKRWKTCWSNYNNKTLYQTTLNQITHSVLFHSFPSRDFYYAMQCHLIRNWLVGRLYVIKDYRALFSLQCKIVIVI